MVKEEELKIVYLKVTVNCCEGCRRKVAKTLCFRGVLRVEIHPTFPKVTVVGDVDAKLLVKKLAKIGKIAEVVTPPPWSSEKKDNKVKDGDNAEHKARKPSDKCTQDECTMADDTLPSKGAAKSSRGNDGDAAGKGRQEPSIGNGGGVGGCGATTVNYHRVEPMVAPPMYLPYYATNPMPYGGGYYYAMPPLPPPRCCSRPPVSRPQRSRFDEDLFSDDNTVGCSVM